MPDPLGPTRAVRLPGTASRGCDSSAARRVRTVPSTSRVVRSTTNGRAAEGGVPRGRRGRDQGRVDGHRCRRPLPRHPDPHGEQPLALGGEGGADGAVRDDAAVVGEHDEPLDEVDPRTEDVLDDDERRRGRSRGRRTSVGCRHRPPLAGRQGRDGIPDLLRGGRVEHRGRLVEQDDRRVERQRPGERQPLRLPTRQRRGGGVEGEGAETDRRQGRGDDAGHVGARHPDVLRPERHVPPDGRRDDPGARLLEHEPHGAGALPRRDAVDAHRADEVTRVGRLQEACEGPQEGGLARPRGADEQHAFAGPEGEGDVAQHRLAAAERAPGQAVDLHPSARDGPHRGHRAGCPRRGPGRQTAWDSRCSCPAGKADSAPARASARTRSQPTSPASTAPETAIAPR